MAGETTLTLLTADGATTAEATVDGAQLRVPADAVEAATGWTLKPEGLCRAEACIPLRDPDAVGAGGVDLAAVASALRRPLAFEHGGAEAVAVLGDAAADRTEAQRGLRAAPFSLPGVRGGTVSLADHAGAKRLLLAWASW
jgi:hypothetical protein